MLHQPTGFHLLQAIAGLIEGDHNWLRPGLIVIDAFSRGCSGATIAAGLRELGITIPIVLVTAPGQPMPLRHADHTVRIASLADVDHVVRELAPHLRAPDPDLCEAVKEDHEHAHPVQQWPTRWVPPQLGSAASVR